MNSYSMAGSPGGSYAAEAPPVGGSSRRDHSGHRRRGRHGSPSCSSPSPSSSVHSSMREIIGGGGAALRPSVSLSGLVRTLYAMHVSHSVVRIVGFCFLCLSGGLSLLKPYARAVGVVEHDREFVIRVEQITFQIIVAHRTNVNARCTVTVRLSSVRQSLLFSWLIRRDLEHSLSSRSMSPHLHLLMG